MRYIIFDRSRNEAFAKCPRLRFIEYEYPTGGETHGITRQAMAVPLLTGGTIHRGIEAFVSGQQENEAVQIALDEYDQSVNARGIEIDETSPDALWTTRVQRLLAEALIRGWVRYVWPKLNAEFEALDIEQEERLEIPVDEETVMVLLARSDLIMRRKADGNVFVFNHKSIAQPDDRKLQALRYDTQSISEVLAAQARYEAYAHTDEKFVQIDGVIYDLLVKGPKKAEYPKGSGVWHNASPLIWAYVKEGQTGITADELAARWEWTCTAPHPAYRGTCPGGAKHTLGPKYHRKLITEVFKDVPAVDAWFAWLEEHEPGFIESQFQTLAPVMRSPFDVERWKRATLTEEWGIADRAEAVRAQIAQDGWNGAQNALDINFPMHSAHGNCFWPSKCQCFMICWGTGGQVDDLLQIEGNDGQPLFAPRKANHPEAGAQSTVSED